MRLSTRGRYGTRFMLDLALHYGQGPLLLREISERQEISIKYLEQLIPPLKAAGLVKSTRGPHGGYQLARPPAEIVLLEIIRVLEGSTAVTECVDDPESCARAGQCVTREVWGEVSGKIEEVLEAVTLERMAERHRRLAASYAYQI